MNIQQMTSYVHCCWMAPGLDEFIQCHDKTCSSSHNLQITKSRLTQGQWSVVIADLFRSSYRALRGHVSLHKKATIHQVTMVLATSKNVRFPGNAHLLTTSTDDQSPSCWRSGNNQSVGSSVPVVSRWLWPGNMSFLEVACMVVTWGG